MAEKHDLRSQDQIDSQAREQTGAQQVRLRLDDHDMTTIYANAFRTHTTAEEVMVDFGMNMVVPSNRPAGAPAPAPGAGPGGAPEEPMGDILFKLNNRVVMNYYTAKRLALLLGQVIRRHEERFGELKLNAAERVKS
ncbi:MAG: DUF3467 domain-containing protein [Phycisphaeraceae bacterium]|nr:DUF3467 domain-containing protein [Phycisphaeraceae bacterium]